jgi:hypothetical protein
VILLFRIKRYTSPEAASSASPVSMFLSVTWLVRLRVIDAGVQFFNLHVHPQPVVEQTSTSASLMLALYVSPAKSSKRTW